MRLKSFSITNFRSIVCSGDFNIFDDGIMTLIGGNGSGKSNILKALNHLKSNGELLTDSDFNVKATGNIAISASFYFENNDEELLRNHGLETKDISGFQIVIDKEVENSAKVTLLPIDFKTSSKIEPIRPIIDEITNIIAGFVLPEETLAVFRTQTDDFESPNYDFGSFESLLDVNKELIGEEKYLLIKEKIEKIKANRATDIESILRDILNNFNIELLSIENYKIEDNAPISELNDSTAHPFLYDILELSGKKAVDFGNKSGRALDHIEEESSDMLSDAINVIWPSHDIKFKIDRNDGALDFFVYTPQGKTIELTNLSDGEQWFLRFYIKLAISQKNQQQILWLFDEPGRDLHASSQSDLKLFFDNTSDKFQIIYSTHQPMMVPWSKLERLFVVENNKDDGTIIHKRFWKDSKLGSPLKEALSTFIGEELFSGKQHIIIEGISDYFFLQGWLRYLQLNSKDDLWNSKFNHNFRAMVPVDGIEKVPLYCMFLTRETKNNINWVALVDSSVEKDDLVSAKFPNVGLESLTKKVISVQESSNAKSIKEIEELFTLKEYFNLVFSFYSRNWPKIALPTLEEIEQSQEDEKRTKKINRLIIQKNPDYKINDREFTLDKTGIAQEFYTSLPDKSLDNYSSSTIKRFTNILTYIDKKFDEK